MSPADRTTVLRRLRQIAVGDSAYILRCYVTANQYDIAETLGLPLVELKDKIRTTPDAELYQTVMRLCDQPPGTAVRCCGADPAQGPHHDSDCPNYAPESPWSNVT